MRCTISCPGKKRMPVWFQQLYIELLKTWHPGTPKGHVGEIFGKQPRYSQEAERTNVPAARLARNVIECYLVVVKSHPADCLKIRREAKVGYLAGFANPAHSWLWNLERMQVFKGLKRSQELSNLQEKGLGEECGRLLVPLLGPASRKNQPQQMSIPGFLHLQKHAGSPSGRRFPNFAE